MSGTLAGGWLAAKQAQHPQLVEQLLKQTGSKIDEISLRCYRYLINQPKHNQGVLAMMTAWNLNEVQHRLPLLKIPVQLQIGTNDQTVPPSLADAAMHLDGAIGHHLAAVVLGCEVLEVAGH